MRNFFQSHWKAIVALILLILMAALYLRPGPASGAQALAERLERHVGAIASPEHNARTLPSLESAAVYIEKTLAEAGYRSTRQAYAAGGGRVHNIEVSIGNVAPGGRPERIFIVGAHYDSAQGTPGANDKGGGTAAVLELARLLHTMRPSAGTEVRFVFFVNEEPPCFMGEEMGRYRDTGNFIAFVGTLESSKRVREALAAFRAASDFPAAGLAAPAHTTGVTLSDHTRYERHGYPALMITESAFMRYPYYQTAEDPPDKPDYESMARVVTGLEKTIRALAGAARG